MKTFWKSTSKHTNTHCNMCRNTEWVLEANREEHEVRFKYLLVSQAFFFLNVDEKSSSKVDFVALYSAKSA